ncbi:hypothetical protein SAMN06297251_101385 [Fulvimarina manganoxydans]|uniref:Uncharacterized protein n=1 Tax=Fulvimarina manganoxydans TaxID=937218 RepID=A0A1W1YJH7_9HYPH|nr:hypothetical protein [Fulvimarina manganoxydans]SMC36380.1 hypothetical protein SAMN06297251_101385 [Fulvimarina manganoxydans]
MLDIKKRTTLVRERLLADAIREFVAELRLVDVVDYIAYLRLEHYGNIADIVSSSAELTLKPNVLRFANSGDVRVTWATPPIVCLALELQHQDLTAHFRLELGASTAAVDITYVDFAGHGDADDAEEQRRFRSILADARLERTSPRERHD